MDDAIISAYPLDEAVADGTLVALFRSRWPALTGGKPLVATAALAAELSPAALIEIWNAYVRWRHEVEPTLPEEDRLFATAMNGRTVWLIEDGAAYTILYPEEY